MRTWTKQRETTVPAPSGGRQDRAALETSNLKSLRELFGKMQKQLEAALPKFLTAERMIRVATTTVQKVPKLLQCDPVTVVGAVMQSAALGLEPDNVTGSAYLVPFWNTKMNRMECTLIPGYRGLLALARRSKEISAVDAHVVKAGDTFDFEYGSNQYLRHKPALLMRPGNDGKWAVGLEQDTIAAYMIAFYGTIPRPGEKLPLSQFHVMSRPELEKHKAFTKSRDRNGEIVGPWIEHPDAMFRKTVIRMGSKLLPFSIELMTAVGLEDRAIAGKSQNLGALVAEDLNLRFDADTDDDDSGGDVDPALVKALDEAFAAINYTEARRTVKLQEYRGRLPELLEWLKAEALRHARPAGQGSTEAAASKDSTKPDAPQPASTASTPAETITNAPGGPGGPAEKPAEDTKKKSTRAGRFKI
jgi:recombination protein RecT